MTYGSSCGIHLLHGLLIHGSTQTVLLQIAQDMSCALGDLYNIYVHLGLPLTGRGLFMYDTFSITIIHLSKI